MFKNIQRTIKHLRPQGAVYNKFKFNSGLKLMNAHTELIKKKKPFAHKHFSKLFSSFFILLCRDASMVFSYTHRRKKKTFLSYCHITTYLGI